MITLVRIAAAGLAALLLFLVIGFALARHVDTVTVVTFTGAATIAVLANFLNFVNLDGLE